MKLRCTQCLDEIADRTGFSAPNGEELCGPCYFALWGPKGRHTLARSTEARRPRSLRPRRAKPIWIPGPTGETDPGFRSRMLRRRPRA